MITALEVMTGEDKKRQELGNQCRHGLRIMIKISRMVPLSEFEETCVSGCGNHICYRESLRDYLEENYFRRKSETISPSQHSRSP